MINKSKRKIVSSIMHLLVFIFITIVLIVYMSAFYAVFRNNQKILGTFTDSYINEWRLDPHPFDDNRKVRSTVFYAIVFDNNDNSVLHIVNDINPLVSSEKLSETAREILNSNKLDGILDKFVYRVTKTDDYTCISFMSNTIMSDTLKSLFENTTIFGFIALAILFVISLKLADKIISPLEENYNKQKQFISDAGHELKTPISTISANTEILEREIGENQWISNIKFENYRMQEIVQQLLDLARTESTEPMMEKINLSRIILGGILPFESVAFEKGYMIESNISKDIEIVGDKRQLGQLISILTDNALSHAEGRGEILITLKLERNMAVLSVSNPGQEIPIEERERIFERFYKTDESRKSDGHYGLGLAISKAIVNVHKGKISISCSGGITTFTAIIPRKQ